METLPTADEQKAIDEVFSVAANLLIRHKKHPEEVIATMQAQGIDKDTATIIVERLEKQIKSAKNINAKKDMLYGALWCVGGTVLTMAHIGFIFWGAIVFGAVQFFRGLINMA